MKRENITHKRTLVNDSVSLPSTPSWLCTSPLLRPPHTRTITISRNKHALNVSTTCSFALHHRHCHHALSCSRSCARNTHSVSRPLILPLRIVVMTTTHEHGAPCLRFRNRTVVIEWRNSRDGVRKQKKKYSYNKLEWLNNRFYKNLFTYLGKEINGPVVDVIPKSILQETKNPFLPLANNLWKFQVFSWANALGNSQVGWDMLPLRFWIFFLLSLLLTNFKWKLSAKIVGSLNSAPFPYL